MSELVRTSLTREQAIQIAQSGVWKDWTDEEIVRFQLFEDKMCMDFSRFMEALENVLRRPVWTHELAKPELLQDELEGRIDAPDFEQILAKLPIPRERVVVAVISGG